MKSFKRILTVMLSCALIICALAIVAACKVEKPSGEGGRLSKDNKIIGNWYCSIPDDRQGVDGTIEKPEGYEAVFKAELYITIEYKEHVGGYQMTINYWWWNLDTRKEVFTEKSAVLLVESDDVVLGGNQYYYKGSFYTFSEHSGYIFTLNDPYVSAASMSASNIADISKYLEFSRAPMSLDDYKTAHSQIQLPEANN